VDADGITGAGTAAGSAAGAASLGFEVVEPVGRACVCASAIRASAAQKIKGEKRTTTTNAVLVLRMECIYPLSLPETAEYSILGIAVDRKHTLKWHFPQRGPQRQVFVAGVEVKATLHDPQKIYVYFENALADDSAHFPAAGQLPTLLDRASRRTGIMSCFAHTTWRVPRTRAYCLQSQFHGRIHGHGLVSANSRTFCALAPRVANDVR
jgi:hypothetical protein